jgi:transcriptional regulator with XRE-family HTH domain
VGENKINRSPVGKRLKEARLMQGVSQKVLGIQAGIDQFSASSRINQYERDKHVPDYQTAKRLADVLRVPVTYLFADDDELAEIILLFSRISKRNKTKIKNLLREL